MTVYQEIEAECCSDSITVIHKCFPHSTEYRCSHEICYDGSILQTSYCGVGICNIFGCDCDGGCRKGDAESAIESFRRLRPHLILIGDE